MITAIDIFLAILTFLVAITAIGGQTWKKQEPSNRTRLSWRGWIAWILALLTLPLMIAKHDIAGRREQARDHLSAKQERSTQLLLERNSLLQSEIRSLSESNARLEKSSAAIVHKMSSPTHQDPEVAALIAEIRNAQVLREAVSARAQANQTPKQLSFQEFQARGGSPKPFAQLPEPLVPPSNSGGPQSVSSEPSTAGSADQPRIVSESTHVKRKEAFVFYVESLRRGEWLPLHPEEIQIESSGRWYEIPGGPMPRYGLKGIGNTPLRVTDLKTRRYTECIVSFEE